MSLDFKMIRESFELAKPIADKIVERFYANLWSDYPASRALFEGVDMVKQRAALIGGLVQVIDNLDQPGRLTSYLHTLGARHVNYGAEDFHYDWVSASLLKTFAEFLGDAWTPPLAQQWTHTFAMIGDAMKQGALSTRVKPPMERQPKLVHTISGMSGVSTEKLNFDLPQEFKNKIREAVQKSVDTLIETEIKNALIQAEKRFDSIGISHIQIKRSAS